MTESDEATTRPDPDSDAVKAAEQMNDPSGPQPGVDADPPESSDDDDLPELIP